MKNLILALAGLFALSIPGFSNTIWVPDDHPTIQGAINAAVNGDEVIVRPGTYVELINFNGKAITVRSELGPEVTTIDGNQAGSVVTFENGEGAASILEGFTITDGRAEMGGGILCDAASPTLQWNVIEGNAALGGAGGGGEGLPVLPPHRCCWATESG